MTSQKDSWASYLSTGGFGSYGHFLWTKVIPRALKIRGVLVFGRYIYYAEYGIYSRFFMIYQMIRVICLISNSSVKASWIKSICNAWMGRTLFSLETSPQSTQWKNIAFVWNQYQVTDPFEIQVTFTQMFFYPVENVIWRNLFQLPAIKGLLYIILCVCSEE